MTIILISFAKCENLENEKIQRDSSDSDLDRLEMEA